MFLGKWKRKKILSINNVIYVNISLFSLNRTHQNVVARKKLNCVDLINFLLPLCLRLLLLCLKLSFILSLIFFVLENAFINSSFASLFLYTSLFWRTYERNVGFIIQAMSGRSKQRTRSHLTRVYSSFCLLCGGHFLGLVVSLWSSPTKETNRPDCFLLSKSFTRKFSQPLKNSANSRRNLKVKFEKTSRDLNSNFNLLNGALVCLPRSLLFHQRKCEKGRNDKHKHWIWWRSLSRLFSIIKYEDNIWM